MIVITGDSWGVGEYSKKCELSGPGFANYLGLSNTVVNLSKGGNSNSRSIRHLKTFLARLNSNFDSDIDTFYWVVTDPIRDISKSICHTSDSLKHTTTTALYHTLQQADELAIEYSIRLKLIGGLCDLNTIDISEFRNLEIVVPSWGQLLLADYNTSMYGDLAIWTGLGPKIKEERFDLIHEWSEIANEIADKYKSYDTLRHTFFSTDGCHPDRKGHLFLRDYLHPESKNFK